MNADPSVLLACTALYLIVVPSPITSTSFPVQLRTPKSFSIQPPLILTFLFLLSFRPSDPPQFSSGASNPTVPSRGSNVVQASSVTQSEGSRTICEAPVFLPASQMLMDFVPDGSRSGLAHEYSKVNANPTGYGIV